VEINGQFLISNETARPSGRVGGNWRTHKGSGQTAEYYFSLLRLEWGAGHPPTGLHL